MGNLSCKKSDEEILAAEEDLDPLDRSRHDLGQASLGLGQDKSSSPTNGVLPGNYPLTHVHDRPSIGDLFPNLKGSTQLSDTFDLYDYIGEDKWGMIFMHPGKFFFPSLSLFPWFCF